MSRTADQIVGNQIRVTKNVLLEERYPTSGIGTQLSAGRLTPVVQSWVTRNGSIYWQFGEIGTNYYLKHDKAFKVEEYRGGASFLNPKEETGLSLFNFGAAASETAQLIKKVAIGGAIIGTVLVLLKFKDVLD